MLFVMLEVPELHEGMGKRKKKKERPGTGMPAYHKDVEQVGGANTGAYSLGYRGSSEAF